jgi:predicted nucleic acid-binding protein
LLNENALILLHWGIVLEIADGYARIGRRSKGNQLLEKFASEDGYQISPLTTSLFEESLMLYRDRPDKEWGLTDCISFQLMEQEGISEALTADVHFQQAGFNALLLNQ